MFKLRDPLETGIYPKKQPVAKTGIAMVGRRE
jgi:hypothetical protein